MNIKKHFSAKREYYLITYLQTDSQSHWVAQKFIQIFPQDGMKMRMNFLANLTFLSFEMRNISNYTYFLLIYFNITPHQ